VLHGPIPADLGSHRPPPLAWAAVLDCDVLIVDGMNVLGSRPDGWWRDRPAAMRRLVGGLDSLARELDLAVEVCFDGSPHAAVADAATDRVAVSFAPGGPNAADRAIAERVRGAEDPGGLLVVTSDRRLQAAIKAAGGRSTGAGAFAREHLAGR
jgi:predicted RNA-binding protein with PIN domain